MRPEATALADACPSRDQLMALLGDDLPGDLATRLENHLDACAACLASVLELGGHLDIEPLHAGMEPTATVGATLPEEPRADFLERLAALAVQESGKELNIERAPVEVRGPNLPGIDVLDELGRGSLGIVYLARHKLINRLVALKAVPVERLSNGQELERARRGVEAVTHLLHPNIIQIFHVGRHEGWFYGTLEFMEGGSLKDRLTGAPWGSMPAAKLIVTLARAVEFIHSQGIVHRDLKPANVLFKADGTAKLADFGLARSFAESSNLTLDGEALGTPRYMAPEQAMGRQDLGPSADIYALGAILYELLTGRPPFRGATKLDTLYQVVHLPPVPVSRLQPGVPRNLAQICMRCLEKSPEMRYPSATALASDLERFIESKPIRPVSFRYLMRLRTTLTNHPALSLLTAMLLIVALLELIAMGALWRETSDVNRRDRFQIYNAQVVQLNAQLNKTQSDLTRLLPDLAEYEIEDGNIDKARDLLTKVPPNSRDARWQKLMDQCPEPKQP
jgi:eukaryotic-like serine/threonine-protein kinase